MKGYIKRVNGWKRSKGVTLVELIAVMSISLVIMAISLNLLVTGIRHLSDTYKLIKNTCEIDDGLLSIERLLDETKINQIKFETGVESKIIINSDEGKGDVYKKNTLIFYESNKIKVKRDKYYVATNIIESSGTNTLLNNVISFDIYEKGRLYYLHIKHDSGIERIVCLQ